MLERPRLLEPLAAAEDKKLIAVLAPAGFGKTTLLKQHTARSRRKTAWLTLRDDAADASTLARDTMYALQSVIPNMTFSHTKEALSIEARGNRLGVTLARDLNVVNSNLNIVFDRIEYLSTSSSSLIESLVEELGEGHQVLVAGYEGNPLPVSRFAVDGLALAFSSSELNFTAEETVELLQARGFEGDAVQAHESMAGWSLGIAMVANGDTVSMQPNDVINQLFERLPDDIRAWLPELSVLDVWSEKIIQEIGYNLPKNWLKKLIEKGLPITKINFDEYQPHFLLNEKLIKELFKEPSKYKNLHRTAAIYEERCKNLIKAAKNYNNSEDYESAIRIVIQITESARRRGEIGLQKDVLRIVPESRLPINELVILMNRRIDVGDVIEAEKTLLNLYENGSRNFSLLLTLGNIERKRGNGDLKLRFLSQIDLDSLNNIDKASFYIEKASAIRHSYDSYANKDSFFDEQIDYLNTAMQLCESTNNFRLKALAISDLANIYGDLGNFEKARELYSRATKICVEAGQLDLLYQISFNKAILLADVGEVTECKYHLEENIKLCRKNKSIWGAFFLLFKSSFEIYCGKPSNALEIAYQARQELEIYGEKLRVIEANFYIAQAKILMNQELESDIFSSLVKKEDGFSGGAEFYYSGFVKAMFYFSKSDYEKAKSNFESIKGIISPIDEVRILAYMAEMSRREGRNWESSIEEIFEKMKLIGHDYAIIADKMLLNGLYSECSRRNLYKERIDNLLNFEEKTLENTKDIIDINCVGSAEFKFLKKNLKIRLQKSKELLLWLSIQGPASRTEIINALWGHLTPQSKEYFKVAVRKLRAELLENSKLRSDPILFESGLYQLHPDITVKWDFKLIQQRLLDGKYIRSDLETIANLPGTFLIGFNSNWVQDFKQGVLDSIYSALLETAQKVNSSQVIELLETAIAVNPLSEDAYRKLAAVLRQSGKTEEAARVQQRFVAALES
jgi:LuxR family transcriptional regulator, maltose regulon positive regulatory protein